MTGMKRRGFKREELHRVRRAYRALFSENGIFRERIEAVKKEFSGDPVVGKILSFIDEGGARTLMQPQARHGDAGSDSEAAP